MRGCTHSLNGQKVLTCGWDSVWQAVSSKRAATGEPVRPATAMEFDMPPIWRSASVTGSATGVRHHVSRPTASGGTAGSGNDGLPRPTAST